MEDPRWRIDHGRIRKCVGLQRRGCRRRRGRRDVEDVEGVEDTWRIDRWRILQWRINHGRIRECKRPPWDAEGARGAEGAVASKTLGRC